MKIFIDIGHPAHVHYFRNFIKIMESKGHVFFVSSREKECTFELLKSYDITFFSRGSGKNGFLGKLFYMLQADRLLLKEAKKFGPDIFLSFVSPYAAQVSWLLNKPHIAFDDTEHANMARKFYKPFTKTIFTPACFKKDLGTKQIRFKSFMELCYLHPNYFIPNKSIYQTLNISEEVPFVLLRFVSFKANHDLGHSGLDMNTKLGIIEKLKAKFKIFISSESELPDELKGYKINIPAHRMHDVLAFASLFIGEGATMASECAMLGTPAIYVNSLNAGTLEKEEELGLIYGFRNSKGVLEKLNEILLEKEVSLKYKVRKDQMLKEMIDPTKMMVDFFEGTYTT